MTNIIVLILFFICFQAQAYELETVFHKQDFQSIPESNGNSIDINKQETLDEESLKVLNATSVDDLFRLTPSATTSKGPRSSGEAIQVRGLDTNKIFIMVDGSRQNYRSGHSSMTAVDMENLKSVEVFKTAGDFSKGGSLGGGVQFITKDAEDYLELTKQVGSEFKLQHSGANNEKRINAKSIFKKKDYSGLISLTNAKADNLELNDGNELERSSYEDFALLTKFKFKNIKLNYEYFQREDNSPLDPSLNPPASIDSLHAKNKTIKNNISLNHKTNQGFDSTLYHQQFKTEKTRESDKEIQTRVIQTTGLNLSKKLDSWTVGSEIYQDHLDSESEEGQITAYPKANGTVSAVYLEKKFQYENFKVNSGLKYSAYTLESDNNSIDTKSGNNLSKKLGSTYQLFKSTQLFASYSEGYNAPRVTDVYPSGLHARGDGWIIRDNYFIPNLDLKAETSQIKEAGFKFERHLFSPQDQLLFKVSAYENKVKDYIQIQRIDRSTADDEDGTSQFTNIPNVNLFGNEIELRYLYAIYDFKISYSQIRGKNETDKLYLEDLPADQYTYDFRAFIDKYNLSFGYLGIQTKEQNRTNPETIQRTVSTPGYFIHNLFVAKKLGSDFEINVRIDNVGNQKYRKHASHLYESSEDVKIGIKYKINTL